MIKKEGLKGLDWWENGMVEVRKQEAEEDE